MKYLVMSSKVMGKAKERFNIPLAFVKGGTIVLYLGTVSVLCYFSQPLCSEATTCVNIHNTLLGFPGNRCSYTEAQL